MADENQPSKGRLQREGVPFPDRLHGPRPHGRQRQSRGTPERYRVVYNRDAGGFEPETPDNQTGDNAPAVRRFNVPNRNANYRLNLPSGSRHMIMAEYILVVGIIILRALADYVPDSDQSKPGKEKPTQGALPLALFAASCIVFFLLSILAQSGTKAARIAVAFGALVIVALLVNSTSELETVSGWIDNIGSSSSSSDSSSSGSNSSGSSSSSSGSSSSNSSSSSSGSAASNALGAFERDVENSNWNAAHDALEGLKATGDLAVAGYDALNSALNDAENGTAGSAAALSAAIAQFDNPKSSITTRITDLGKAFADGASSVFHDILGGL